MFGAEAKAPFAKREARHHDSHRCRKGGQHGGMSGQQGHGVGVGTWPAGPEGPSIYSAPQTAFRLCPRNDPGRRGNITEDQSALAENSRHCSFRNRAD